MADSDRLVPYDPSRAALYRPGDADDFFASRTAWNGAALCAELSRLSYCDDAGRRARSLARAGLTERAFLDVEGTQALVAVDGGRAFVAFRGTDDPKAAIVNARFAHKPWERGGQVHGGFADYLGKVRTQLEALIRDLADKDLVFTGHSLGAAAATLAMSLWPRGTLCTFGSPRVGDTTFGATIDPAQAERFVDCCDVVCRVPPEALDFVHVGPLRYIAHTGLVDRNPDASTIRLDQDAGRKAYWRHAVIFWKNVVTRDLADHAPINYVVAL